jgi:hypothetical protein
VPAFLLAGQKMLPVQSFLRWAVASVKRNSYGPVVINVPGGVVLRRSVLLSNPPNAHTATASSTKASTIEPYSSGAGMVLALLIDSAGADCTASV